MTARKTKQEKVRKRGVMRTGRSKEGKQRCGWGRSRLSSSITSWHPKLGKVASGERSQLVGFLLFLRTLQVKNNPGCNQLAASSGMAQKGKGVAI